MLECMMDRTAPGWINGFIGVVIFSGSLPATRVAVMQLDPVFVTVARAAIAGILALGLLLISIWKHTRAGRYAALALLGVAVLKLFLHDLQQLGALYRIGALFAVAIIAIVASLADQRFQPGADSTRD